MMEYAVRHNEVEESNSPFNCTECADSNLKLESIEWQDEGDEGFTQILKYRCQKGHVTEIKLYSEYKEEKNE